MTWTTVLTQIGQNAVIPDWLFQMKVHYISKCNSAQADATCILIDQLTKVHGEWQTTQKQVELEECKARVAELEKELDAYARTT